MAERVQRIWKTLITNKYGTQVSWTGQKGKPPVLKSEMFKLAVGGIYFNFILFRARLLFFFHYSAAVCSNPLYALADKKQIEIHSKNWIWQSNKRYTRECQKSGDLNNNVEHKTRNPIQEQIEGDHEKLEPEYKDENEDSEELDNRSESLDSLD